MGDSKKFLSHTADVRVRITSETLPGLFRMGLQSLNQLLSGKLSKPESDVKDELTEQIGIESPDTTSLLIDFLSEALTRSQMNKAIYSKLDIEKMTDCKMSGTLTGFPVTGFEEDVKAVTYHEADVRVNEDGDWETIIIFDI